MKEVNKSKVELLNQILVAMILVLSTLYLVHFINIGRVDRIFSTLAIYFVIFVPKMLEKTKYKLSPNYKFMYIIFIFLAHFLNCIVNLYKSVWWYDLFAHFISGVVTFLLATYILEKSNEAPFKSMLTYFIYLIGFVCFVAVAWEITELSCDLLFSTNLQHNLDTGVIDTMEDIIVALTGGLMTFSVWKKTISIK